MSSYVREQILVQNGLHSLVSDWLRWLPEEKGTSSEIRSFWNGIFQNKSRDLHQRSSDTEGGDVPSAESGSIIFALQSNQSWNDMATPREMGGSWAMVALGGHSADADRWTEIRAK